MLPEVQPYVGPRPFSQSDREFFFGRSREAQEAVSLILSHSVTLLYAQSGAGKTSLLNAQLIPFLSQWEEYRILPIARVGSPLPEGLRLEKIANIYVFNTLMSWDEDRTNPAALARLSLTDFLKQNRAPLDADDSKPSIIIFDQFEEVFTLYPERWHEREELFIQLRDLLEEDRRCRVVFAMREELIAELDPYVHLLPERLRTRIRLERLRAPAALEAIRGPLRNTDRRFAPGVAEELVENLLQTPVMTSRGEIKVAGQFVDLLQLQIVSQALWQSLAPDEVEITREHLYRFGRVDSALSQFYEQAIKSSVMQGGISESTLRRWFDEELITPMGTRGVIYRGTNESAGVPNELVDLLEQRHIVRRELRGGTVWYELAQDRLIKPIQESNEHWLMQQPIRERMRFRMENRAELAPNTGAMAELQRLRRLLFVVLTFAIIGWGVAFLAYLAISRRH